MSFRRIVLAGLPLSALLALGCPDRSGAGALLDGNRPCALRLDGPPPQLAPAPTFSAPSSRIVVEARASEAGIERALSKNVPVQLARESRRPIGAAGLVSYTVRRGGFKVRLQGERLVASTPVSVEVDVCKPLGPVCIGYGRCSPRLAASASMPLVLQEDYSMGKSQVGISMTRGCVIAGYDASGEIRRLARENVGTVQRRIDSSVPDLPGYVRSGWKLLHVPVALDRTTCIKLAPTALAQSKPESEAERLRVRFGVQGHITLESPCAAETTSDAPELPRFVVEPVEPDIALAIPIRLGFADVSAELTRSLATGPADAESFQVAKVTATGVSVGATARVHLRVTLSGTACGELSVLATPHFDAQAARIRLSQVEPVGEVDAELMARLKQRLESRAAVALPIDAASAHQALTTWVEGLTKDLPSVLSAKISLKPAAVERVEVDRDSLIPVLTIGGTATLALE